jgi:hypothetical protein
MEIQVIPITGIKENSIPKSYNLGIEFSPNIYDQILENVMSSEWQSFINKKQLIQNNNQTKKLINIAALNVKPNLFLDCSVNKFSLIFEPFKFIEGNIDFDFKKEQTDEIYLNNEINNFFYITSNCLYKAVFNNIDNLFINFFEFEIIKDKAITVCKLNLLFNDKKYSDFKNNHLQELNKFETAIFDNKNQVYFFEFNDINITKTYDRNLSSNEYRLTIHFETTNLVITKQRRE